ncbi:hypothetical protein SAMN05444422_11577 [Halobiforma haloterrestris]|uniref:Uncharacterized protein n=1 Tax=Natronobacterium haloterrestre TaxID=148448 RepID=A0A1I1LBX5_NATHA|nr:hypothetical protein SAMN05444422_11577 [Halobiforma haloterrestris]
MSLLQLRLRREHLERWNRSTDRGEIGCDCGDADFEILGDVGGTVLEGAWVE